MGGGANGTSPVRSRNHSAFSVLKAAAFAQSQRAPGSRSSRRGSGQGRAAVTPRREAAGRPGGSGLRAALTPIFPAADFSSDSGPRWRIPQPGPASGTATGPRPRGGGGGRRHLGEGPGAGRRPRYRQEAVLVVPGSAAQRFTVAGCGSRWGPAQNPARATAATRRAAASPHHRPATTSG